MTVALIYIQLESASKSNETHHEQIRLHDKIKRLKGELETKSKGRGFLREKGLIYRRFSPVLHVQIFGRLDKISQKL